MSYAEAIISGIVQGVTEFLPISSSGHLVILHHYFGFKEPQLLFDIFLHIGTLFAVAVYFWRDIIKLFTIQKRLLLFIVTGTIPTALIGYYFRDTFEPCFADIKIVGIMLFVTAIFLFAADWAGRRKFNTAQTNGLTWFKALLIGIVQGIAIMPGISRSGSTISSAILLKVDKVQAIRFSFLLFIPAIIGALILKLTDAAGRVDITAHMAIGAFFAFIFGLGAIYLLIKSVINSNLKFFGFYCLLVGGVILAL
jgi:undecaprenyl-diphosphatase